MKKILGILMVAVICILGLCSCAGPETRAKNQDLADRLGDRIEEVLNRGTEIEVKGKHVGVYSLTANSIFIGNGINYLKEHCFTDATKLIQYNNYFELYTKDTVYTFSNTVAGYVIY